jgi:hypothetical protein
MRRGNVSSVRAEALGLMVVLGLFAATFAVEVIEALRPLAVCP